MMSRLTIPTSVDSADTPNELELTLKTATKANKESNADALNRRRLIMIGELILKVALDIWMMIICKGLYQMIVK